MVLIDQENLQWEQEIKGELARLEELSQNRRLVTTESAVQPWLIKNGKNMLNLASNDYLGFAGDERLKNAMVDAVRTYGAGSTASRLIVGNHLLYKQTETELVNWKKAEAGLIINSGYTANLGIVSALVGRGDYVFSDKLNHASIIDGILLSRSKNQRYRHNDLEHLETLLRQAPIEKRKLIVTDSLFSMDGDFANLSGLVQLKEKYNAILMVDEAHSSGIYGENGEGYARQLNLDHRIDIQMGTFSKALGSFGAYVVGKKWLIDYLTNKMRSFIFTTALPPAILGSAKAAIKLVQVESERRVLLKEHASYVRNALGDSGFNLCGSESQIIPIMIGKNDKTMEFAAALQEEGIAAIPVRPPTVPENEARIRFTVTALHQKEDLDWALERIVVLGKRMGIIK
ncbi:8-amino-7-oxononanoate synthase [Bacillus sp. AFS001701]|uniref:8-amino-7-oxononanoate synthase n=1 Tax=Bacillaceae TaxID=186817 RepID=UPI000BF3B344|nr:8-amino-7-oxononanoate synthase [Bacillus sp. AFS001701]PET71606.1 8-amino-7-oxononanoate synthase [Bacillus sp. AFS001701]